MYFTQRYVIYVRNKRYAEAYQLLKQYRDIKLSKFDIHQELRIITEGERFREERYYDENGLSSIAVEIPEHHPQFNEIIRILSSFSDGDDHSLNDPLYFRYYSKQDLQSADWLLVNSHFLKVNPKALDDVFEDQCLFPFTFEDGTQTTGKRHFVFKKDIALRGRIQWKNNFFASLFFGYIPIFCKEETKQILERNHITGIEYRRINKISTGEPLEDIYLMQGIKPFPNKAVVVIQDMPETQCPICKERIVIFGEKGIFGIKKGVLDPTVDFYLTPPMFSSNVSEENEACGYQNVIISQKLYRVLLENHMTRSLTFEPLLTV